MYTYFRNWRKDGTWLKIHQRLREWTRIEKERHKNPSEAIIDSQSVKTAAMVHQAVGYDAGKQIKGRKRFLAVDTCWFGLDGLGYSSQGPRTSRRKTTSAKSESSGTASVAITYDLGR